MLEKLLVFSRFITSFGKVERHYPFPGTGRKENDQEHSYHLAMTAWYLVRSLDLDLDITKVLRYALAHDLVEVHAGDTYIYSTDAALVASKEEREAEAARRIEKDFPEFGDLHEAIATYETKGDREARFVYALDKVTPVMLIREDGGRSWRESGVTLDMLVQNKTPKVALSPEVQPYFDEIVALVRNEKLTAEHSPAPEK